ncbi:Haloacid type II [Mycena kentingensis (nom. inval.)]|nr:Haloacid type II [Mycena kentingensis (nom. inval.)]
MRALAALPNPVCRLRRRAYPSVPPLPGCLRHSPSVHDLGLSLTHGPMRSISETPESATHTAHGHGPGGRPGTPAQGAPAGYVAAEQVPLVHPYPSQQGQGYPPPGYPSATPNQNQYAVQAYGYPATGSYAMYGQNAGLAQTIQAWGNLISSYIGWPDSTPGLYALKKFILATLSNGSVRLLIDMAKFADLPWDAVFSSELFSSYKPNPKVYLGAAQHLSLNPENCAMVAAHVYDLRAAAALGMRTVYIPHPGEEPPDVGEVKSKAEGGEVDVVVGSFEELARLLVV